MKRYCSTKDRPCYTCMREILLALGGEALPYKWLISDIEAYPQDGGRLDRLLAQCSYLLLTTKELLDMLGQRDFQWIWAVFSAIPDSVGDGQILGYPLPTARDNSRIYEGPVIQHPLAELEIVAEDSSAVFLVSREDWPAERFRALFPGSKSTSNGRNTMTPEKLISMAKEAMTHAYVPYSGYKVGAALLCADGTVYCGCNIENASYSPTNCAERTAFFKAVYDGHRDFVSIAVCGGKDGVITGAFPPCGVCRQVMREFCRDDFVIYMAGAGESHTQCTLAQLLPFSFSSDDMK